MKKVIHTETLAANDLAFVQAALTKTIAAARVASSGKGQDFGGSSTIHVEDEFGWNVTGIALIEETLSDGSKVYNARLLFGELSEPVKAMAEATERRLKRGNRKTARQ